MLWSPRVSKQASYSNICAQKDGHRNNKYSENASKIAKLIPISKSNVRSTATPLQFIGLSIPQRFLQASLKFWDHLKKLLFILSLGS